VEKMPKKKGKKAVEKPKEKEILLEEVKPEELEEVLLRRPEEEVREREQKLMDRTAELESKIYSVETSINRIKREDAEFRASFHKMEENVEDAMKLYEVVSAQENPFVSYSKITTAALERVNDLEEKVAALTGNLDDLSVDMRIIIGREVDVEDIVTKAVIGAL
jgi:archaellum component FlaC